MSHLWFLFFFCFNCSSVLFSCGQETAIRTTMPTSERKWSTSTIIDVSSLEATASNRTEKEHTWNTCISTPLIYTVQQSVHPFPFAIPHYSPLFTIHHFSFPKNGIFHIPNFFLSMYAYRIQIFALYITARAYLWPQSSRKIVWYIFVCCGKQNEINWSGHHKTNDMHNNTVRQSAKNVFRCPISLLFHCRLIQLSSQENYVKACRRL